MGISRQHPESMNKSEIIENLIELAAKCPEGHVVKWNGAVSTRHTCHGAEIAGNMTARLVEVATGTVSDPVFSTIIDDNDFEELVTVVTDIFCDPDSNIHMQIVPRAILVHEPSPNYPYRLEFSSPAIGHVKMMEVISGVDTAANVVDTAGVPGVIFEIYVSRGADKSSTDDKYEQLKQVEKAFVNRMKTVNSMDPSQIVNDCYKNSVVVAPNIKGLDDPEEAKDVIARGLMRSHARKLERPLVKLDSDGQMPTVSSDYTAGDVVNSDFNSFMQAMTDYHKKEFENVEHELAERRVKLANGEDRPNLFEEAKKMYEESVKNDDEKMQSAQAQPTKEAPVATDAQDDVDWVGDAEPVSKEDTPASDTGTKPDDANSEVAPQA